MKIVDADGNVYSKLEYTLIEQAVCWGWKYPPAVEMTKRARPILDYKMASRTAPAKRLFLHLISIGERMGWNNRFHGNHNESPVSVRSTVLAHFFENSHQATTLALHELASEELIEGSDPHFGIVDRKFYYRLPRKTIGRVPISTALRLEVISVGKCARCGSRERLSVDHITPVVFGGGNDRSNLQCLCLRCNCAKRDRYIG